MVAFKIAFRSLMRRKIRMAMIGLLVLIGTILIICGETFSLSAKHFSKESIIKYFTGDIVLYSDQSKEKPSPFAFTTPLPLIENPQVIEAWLKKSPVVESHVAIAQNYGLLSIDKSGKKTDVPFVFYAVDPIQYRKTFPNILMTKGLFFNTDSGGTPAGVVLSAFQAKNYSENYSVDIAVGDDLQLLSLSEGGAVNAYPSKIVGIYEPKFYKNVFNYINFIDIVSYSRLYNFTGVDASSLPENINTALSLNSENDIFNLAAENMDILDTKNLISRDLSGYSMIAVKFKENSDIPAFIDELNKQGFRIKIAHWNEASGFFASVAQIIQAIIYGAVFLIFLIVIFILMNTLIINVLERTGEIGTLRAMGGEKSLITSIFLWESFLLNGSAALCGMFISLLIITTIGGNNGIALPDIMQQYLVGGSGLQLLLSPWPFFESIGLIIAVSAVATLYPIMVANAISPLKAMSSR